MATLSGAAVQALEGVDALRYHAVWPGDLVITPTCALAQIQGLADEIRRLESL